MKENNYGCKRRYCTGSRSIAPRFCCRSDPCFFFFFLSQQERWQDVSLLVWGRTGVLTPASTADTLTIPRHVLLPNHCCSDFGWLLFSHLQSSYPQSWQEDWPLSGPDCIPTVQTIQSCFPVFLGGITNSSCG